MYSIGSGPDELLCEVKSRGTSGWKVRPTTKEGEVEFERVHTSSCCARARAASGFLTTR